ncbi:hypothetical protein GJ496_006488 [Pomphorhynchus laevis]|nr:hypothetical protein GJ496_006488 [Pomphorhynchus laevis]
MKRLRLGHRGTHNVRGLIEHNGRVFFLDLKLSLPKWEEKLPNALSSIRRLLCTATSDTPHCRFFFIPLAILSKSWSTRLAN